MKKSTPTSLPGVQPKVLLRAGRAKGPASVSRGQSGSPSFSFLTRELAAPFLSLLQTHRKAANCSKARTDEMCVAAFQAAHPRTYCLLFCLDVLIRFAYSLALLSHSVGSWV